MSPSTSWPGSLSRALLVSKSAVAAGLAVALAACGGGDNPPPYDIPTQQRLSNGTTVHAQASADIRRCSRRRRRTASTSWTST